MSESENAPVEREGEADRDAVAPLPAQPEKKRKLPALKHIATGVPIVGITGTNGAGKTLIAVDAAAREIAHGRVVYSTVQIDTPWGSSLPITSLAHLLTLRDCLLVLDEIAVVFSSGDREAMPSEVVVLLQVLRHRNVTVIWTGPSWGNAYIGVRRVTQGSVTVFPLVKAKTDSPWPKPLVIAAGLMDCVGLKLDAEPTKIMRRKLYIPKRMIGWGMYDTLADTPMLAATSLGGRCPGCGGSRTVPKHSRERHEELGIPFHDYELHALMGAGESGAPRFVDEGSPDSVGTK